MKVPSERGSGLLGAMPANLVKKLLPDYVVGLETLLGQFRSSPEANYYSLIEEPIFLDDDLKRTNARSLWVSLSILIYRRK